MYVTSASGKKHTGNHKIHFILHLEIVPIALWKSDEEIARLPAVLISRVQGSSLTFTLGMFFLVPCSVSLKPFPHCWRGIVASRLGIFCCSLLRELRSHFSLTLQWWIKGRVWISFISLTIISSVLLSGQSTLETLDIHMVANQALEMVLFCLSPAPAQCELCRSSS